jgi:hypothetical protein
MVRWGGFLDIIAECRKINVWIMVLSYYYNIR